MSEASALERLSIPPESDSAPPIDEVLTAREEQRNFRLTVVNGIMTGGPSMLFEPTTVVAALIIHLNGSQALVGLVCGLVSLGWVWPQLFVANWIEPKPRKLFVYHITAGVRVGSLAAIAVLMWVLRHNLPGWFLYAMIALLFVCWSGNGFSAVGWYDVFSKIIPGSKRPVVFAWRQTGAGVVALLAGLVVSWALGSGSGMTFPTNYFFLLALMTALTAVGIGAFSLVHEPADYHTAERRRPWKQYFRFGTEIMRHDHNYRCLFFGQVSFGLGVMATPFLVPFLIREVGIDDSVIGVLMAVAAGTDLLVNIYWGHLGTRRGNRSVLVQASRLASLAPLAALTVLFVPPATILGLDARVVLVAASLVVSRVGGSGIGVGRMNYLLDIAPQGVRPSYVGFMNTFSTFSILVPIVAGKVIDTAGYLPVFATAAVFGIVTIAAFIRLDHLPNGQANGEFRAQPSPADAPAGARAHEGS